MNPRPRRRWYQFSLRSLLGLMLLGSLMPGIWAVREGIKAARERARIEAAYAWFDTLGYPIRHNDHAPHDLAARAKQLLSDSASDGDALRFAPWNSKRADLFILGWECRNHGQAALARELFYAAENVTEWNEKAAAKELIDRVANDIAHTELWRAIVSFGDPEIPRTALLEKLRWLEKHFAHTEHAPRIQETAAMLQRMVEEDRRHAEQLKQSPPLEQLPAAEQIAELIFRLRDQNGQQWSQPGWCDVFHTGSEEKSPAELLLDHGYDAVPQLIDALADERLTRSVGYHRNFYFSHTVLTVGSAAEQILVRIAGRRFDSPEAEGGSQESDDDYTRVLQNEVRAWYAELQRKGERQMLIEAVSQGDDTAADLAPRLVEKYPLDAAPALLTGLSAANDEYVREQLITLLGEVESDEPVPWLFHEMENSPDRFAQLDAAGALWRRRRPEALEAMIQRWRSAPAGEDSLGRIGTFLVRTGSLEGLTAVAGRFAEQSVDVRLDLLDAAADQVNEPGDFSGEYRAAVMKLLLFALSDETVRAGMSGSYGNKSFSDPRVCDMAGYHLNELDPERFPFDLNANLTERNRQRYAILAHERELGSSAAK